MKFRTTLLLFGFLIALLAALYIVKNDGISGSDKQRPLLTSNVIAQSDRIEIIGFDEEEGVTLSKDQGDWKIGNADVDSDEWETFVEALEKTTRGDLVSKNSANWEQYGLEEGAFTMISFRDAERSVLTLYIGDSATSYRSFYYRKNDQPEVYKTSTSFGAFLNYDALRWRDKTLFPLEEANVMAVTVRVGEEKWSFDKTQGDWTYAAEAGPQEIDQEAFAEYWKDLKSLKASAFEGDMSLFESADNAVALQLKDGGEYVISIDSLEDGTVVAMASGSDLLFRLSSDLAARLTPQFIPEPPAEDAVDAPSVDEVSEVE